MIVSVVIVVNHNTNSIFLSNFGHDYMDTKKLQIVPKKICVHILRKKALDFFATIYSNVETK